MSKVQGSRTELDLRQYGDIEALEKLIRCGLSGSVVGIDLGTFFRKDSIIAEYIARDLVRGTRCFRLLYRYLAGRISGCRTQNHALKTGRDVGFGRSVRRSDAQYYIAVQLLFRKLRRRLTDLHVAIIRHYIPVPLSRRRPKV